MYTVVTVAEEYGSGGNLIARSVANKLGWTLLDSEFPIAMQRAGAIDAATAHRYDERADSWWRRLHHGGLRGAAIVAGMNPDQALFGSDAVAALARQVILVRARVGRCVIVGRGAQCVLCRREEAFNVFIYAPWEDRVFRAYSKVDPNRNIGRMVRSIDEERASYIATYYGRDWKDPHLYQMMVDSQIGVETAASMIVNAVRNTGGLRVEYTELSAGNQPSTTSRESADGHRRVPSSPANTRHTPSPKSVKPPRPTIPGQFEPADGDVQTPTEGDQA